MTKSKLASRLALSNPQRAPGGISAEGVKIGTATDVSALKHQHGVRSHTGVCFTKRTQHRPGRGGALSTATQISIARTLREEKAASPAEGPDGFPDASFPERGKTFQLHPRLSGDRRRQPGLGSKKQAGRARARRRSQSFDARTGSSQNALCASAAVPRPSRSSLLTSNPRPLKTTLKPGALPLFTLPADKHI